MPTDVAAAELVRKSAPQTSSPWIAPALIAGSALLVYLQVFNPVEGDVPLYRSLGRALLNGTPLYSVQRVEYPPYVLVWWILPALAGSVQGAIAVFGMELLALDVAIKVLLYREGRRLISGAGAFVPLAVFIGASLALDYIYLKRFDLIPAAMTFFGAVCFVRGRPLTSGLLFAAAIGTKLYPVVLVPLLCVAAWRQGVLKRFVTGGVIGLAPLAILAPLMPWWHFAETHTGRGLQVESLYAGFVWLAHQFGAPAEWVNSAIGTEVHGPWATTIEPFAHALWVIAVVLSVAISAWSAMGGEIDQVGPLSRLILLPLVAFVAFNFVLSPQYMIWLMGFVALASTAGWRWPLVCLVAACLLGPLIFPTRTYFHGYDLLHVMVLCVRNGLLVAAWGGLLVGAMVDVRPSSLLGQAEARRP